MNFKQCFFKKFNKSPILKTAVPRVPATPKWQPQDPMGTTATAGVSMAWGKGAFTPLLQVDSSWWQWVSIALCLCFNGYRVEEACVGSPGS